MRPMSLLASYTVSAGDASRSAAAAAPTVLPTRTTAASLLDRAPSLRDLNSRRRSFNSRVVRTTAVWSVFHGLFHRSPRASANAGRSKCTTDGTVAPSPPTAPIDPVISSTTTDTSPLSHVAATE